MNHQVNVYIDVENPPFSLAKQSTVDLPDPGEFSPGYSMGMPT